MGRQTLILNASFEPLNIVSWQKALQLLLQGKVEVVEESDREIRTVCFSIRVPSILRLNRYVSIRYEHQIVRFSRSNILVRDQYRCQYCGIQYQKHHLTLDHVTPVIQGGVKTWENIVTSCKKCNQRKGGRTPGQAQMPLIREPFAPRWLPSGAHQVEGHGPPDSWRFYLKA